MASAGTGGVVMYARQVGQESAARTGLSLPRRLQEPA